MCCNGKIFREMKDEVVSEHDLMEYYMTPEFMSYVESLNNSDAFGTEGLDV